MLWGIDMAKKKSVNYNELFKLAESLDSNVQIIRDYIEYIKENNTPENDSSKISYIKIVCKFFNENRIPANDVDESTIKGFLNDHAKTIAASVLKHFYGFVITQTNIPFDLNLIKKPKPKEDINSEKKKESGNKGLTLKEAFMLRHALDDKNNVSLIFTFEMTYCYGLNLNELSECTYEHYDFAKQCFNFKDNTIVYVNEKIAEILDHFHTDILKGRKGEDEGKIIGTYQKQFGNMGKLLIPEILLSHDDIKAAHELHSMKCPLCQQSRLCESDYWCLVIHIEDINQKKRLVCKDCAIKLGLEEHE